MDEPRQDPRLVALSVAAYRRLLALYPASFRSAYGSPMLQLFRDCSLATWRRQGAAGLPPLWVRTLADLIKTAAEEHAQRGVNMTREMFVRLSGWGMILGTILLGMAYSNVADELAIRSFLYDLAGPPTTAPAYTRVTTAATIISLLPGVLGLALLTLGVFGLLRRYGHAVKQSGTVFLQLSTISGVVATLGAFSLLFELPVSWPAFFYGVVAMALFLGLFGVVALREKPMPSGNALPLLAGLPFAVVALAMAVLDFSDSVQTLSAATALFSAVFLILLGYTLANSVASDAESPDGVARMPA